MLVVLALALLRRNLKIGLKVFDVLHVFLASLFFFQSFSSHIQLMDAWATSRLMLSVPQKLLPVPS